MPSIKRARPSRPKAVSPEAPVRGNEGFFDADCTGTVVVGEGTVATGRTGATGAGAVGVGGGVTVTFNTELNTWPTTSAPT